MAIDIKELTRKDDVCFSFPVGNGAAIVTIALTRLQKDVKSRLIPVTMVPVDNKHAVELLQRGATTAQAVQRVVRKSHAVSDPIWILRMPDGTNHLADGEDRYCACALIMQREIPARIIPLSVWEKHLVTGMKFTDAQCARIIGRPLSTVN